MTKVQSQIIELMAKLPPAERRELVEHFYDTNAFADGVIDRLSPEQRSRLDQSIEQADAGESIPADKVFGDLATKHSLSRT